MGIRGLTTYISTNHRKYLRSLKLHSTYVIIDGNSLACQIFVRCCSRVFCAFGGDYDKYAQAIREFFQLLKQCDIKPIVLFDGGYEERKLKTVIQRLRDRAAAIKHAASKPASESSPVIFPLLYRTVFRQVLADIGVPFVQCDFEADQEIAALARKFGCPVISYDSDYFIYDVQYIPIPTMELEAKPLNFELKQSSNKFCIHCKIYRIEHFLDSFGGLDKSLLPLLASLLGNDYVKISVFKKFHSQMKVPKGKSSPVQRRIARVIEWLRNEKTFGSALKKILGRMKQRNRLPVVKKIKDVISAYSQDKTSVEPYLPIDFVGNSSSQQVVHVNTGSSLLNLEHSILEVDGMDVEMDNLELEEEKSDEEEDDDDDDDDDDYVDVDDNEGEEYQLDSKLDGEEMDMDVTNYSVGGKKTSKKSIEIPDWLSNQSRKGYIEPCVFDILTLRTYFSAPQVEDIFLPPAHRVAIPLLQTIIGILLGNERSDINYWAKNENGCVQRYLLEPSRADLPNLERMNECSLEVRKQVLLKALSVPTEECLHSFPEELKLYICSLIYWIKHTAQPAVNKSHVMSICLCLISLSIIDTKLGYFRKKLAFLKKYGKTCRRLIKMREPNMDDNLQNEEEPDYEDDTVGPTSIEEKSEISNTEQTCEIGQLLADIQTDDCIVAFDSFNKFHQLSEDLKSDKDSYSISDIHSLAQFQNCLQNAMILNSLLLFPYRQPFISKFYSGTFVYNMCVALNKSKDINVYIQNIFSHSPKLLNLFDCLVSKICNLAPVSEVIVKKTRNRKRKRSKKFKNKTEDVSDENEIQETVVENNENDEYHDENNIFSLLSHA